MKKDCPDGSDELECNLIKWDKSYKPTHTPFGTPFKVFVSANILAFPSIDTLGLKFTANFFLNLRWFDDRLQFKNLHDNFTHNSLNNTNKFNIWTPLMSFENGLGSIMAEVKKDTFIYVWKEGQGRLDGQYNSKAGKLNN